MAQTPMSGREQDRVIKQFADAEIMDNAGLIMYIREDGNLAFDTEEHLFTVTKLEATT